MNRREFIRMGGGAFAAWAMGGCATPAVGDDYSVTVLGDMHYDASPMERFHAKALKYWQEKGYKHPARLNEFERNARMWQDICREILDASAKSVRPDAAFALQLGDLVQGDCEDNTLHIAMLREATDLLKRAYPRLPVVSVCGNHDIREGEDSLGAAEPYAEFMTAFESGELASLLPGGVGTTTFGFRRGRDLWLFLDFNFDRRDLAVAKKLLADNPDVRYTFVATHGPVLPMDLWRCRWFYLGDTPLDAERREMRALLAERNAIVLAGHVHTLEHKDWFGDGGRITEMVLNTCAGKSTSGYFPAEPEVVKEDPSAYGYGADDKNGMKALFDEYRPGLRSYFAARAVGHHVLRVSDSGVELDYYGHAALAPTKTFVLR